MTTVATKSQFTPDDLLHLDGLYELVGGKLVEKRMSSLAGKTVVIIAHELMIYFEATGEGEAGSEVTFRCFPHDPDLIRRPDLYIITAARAGEVPEEGHVPVAPDIVIEVISPDDRMNAFEEKLEDYRSAKVKLVWEVNPTFRFVRVHRPDRSTVFLRETDTLTGEDVLPKFSVLVRDLLPPRRGASQPAKSARP